MTEGEEIDQEGYIDALEKRNKQIEGKNVELASTLANTGAINKNENIIQYQIENQELMDKLEHFYRGEYIGTDPTTNEPGWIKPKDTTQIPLNEFGVSAMMEIVSKYIDKNTTLSYYSEMRIYEIMADLGDELILYVLSNYEKMGMSDKFRKTKFRLLIITTVHMIESTYRKAIAGKTIEEINQSKIVTQSDNMGRIPVNQPKQRFNPLNPRSW